ncbi:PilZ domain-containing protein [Candidatus Latescibacterota bacterium]
MGNKRNNERMKVYSFTNSDVFREVLKERCFDENSRNMLDKPAFMVIDTKTGERFGNLVDISTSGIMIVSEMPVIENTVYRLRMEFLHKIYFEAICAWSRDIGTGNYISGLKFSMIDSNDLDVIEETIKRFIAGD